MWDKLEIFRVEKEKIQLSGKGMGEVVGDKTFVTCTQIFGELSCRNGTAFILYSRPPQWRTVTTRQIV